ncbi:OmpA family protein [Steroidobacter sp.]|uniref:OmpA family protein n=1 Tax=Steroidobacter sp. TaxID=1978227 RepID=UPI0039C97940
MQMEPDAILCLRSGEYCRAGSARLGTAPTAARFQRTVALSNKSPSPDRRLPVVALAVAGAVLLAVCGPVSAADSQTEANTNAIGLSIPGHRRLDALAEFLEQHPARNVAIDGYAGAGRYRYDQALSTRRADAVRTYLMRRGIAPTRLTASGNADSTIGTRWVTPGRRYAGWRQNPWINAMCNARSETESSSAADRKPADQPGPDDRQQRAAVRTWENEGASLGANTNRTLSY